MNCTFCGKELSKDAAALTKKMLGRQNERFMCLECLADYLGCTGDDLIIKVEEFKEQGCALFE